jgi:hypothetical protein
MARQLCDITGQRFGRLTAVKIVGRQHRNAVWRLVCDCGGQIDVALPNLRNVHTRSCGCLYSARNLSHGHSLTVSGLPSPTYYSWQSMKNRCAAKTGMHWRYYGSKGVVVCERWLVFENFLADMGPRPPGTTLDRFPDPAGIYAPGNARWATAKQQRKNRRHA